jgi:hypothetical protein
MELEQKLRYLLSRGKISKEDCAQVLNLLDARISDANYWKQVAENALRENSELKAENARLSQIARY